MNEVELQVAGQDPNELCECMHEFIDHDWNGCTACFCLKFQAKLDSEAMLDYGKEKTGQ